MIRKMIPRELYSDKLSDAVCFLSRCEDNIKVEDLVCRDPIFLLSAGWRSGSTLLQRLVCSDTSTIIWGEPFGDRIPIPRLSATIADFCRDDPTIPYAINKFSGELSDEWIANLNPGVCAIRNAHLAFFENLLAKPAREKGFKRWGIKTVRLSAYHAIYLRWLYPEAKFVFLVRNPLSAYRSYKGKTWYLVRPYYRMNNVFKFMALWQNIASSFASEWQEIGAILIRYEDLINETKVVKDLAQFLDIRVNHEVIGKKVGHSHQRDKPELRWWDILVCQMLAGEISRKLGYKIYQKSVLKKIL
ncbi:MAG: sulfotransferase [Candidatus Scalindua sp.]|nr:sulfotransferase [Candidatus Scalindua sp.]